MIGRTCCVCSVLLAAFFCTPSTLAAQAEPLTILTTISERYPRWMPDGERVVFYSDRHGGWELITSGADGANRTRVTETMEDELVPVPSPDGRRLAFVVDDGTQEEIWMLDLADGTRRNLTSDPANDTDPSWSPDGTRIFFVSNRSGNWDVWSQALDGSDLRRHTETDEREALPAVSPDGRWLAFQRTVSPRDADIFVQALDGGTATNVSTDVTWDGWPSWSPDGAWVLFTSNRSGSGQLWEARPDGSEVRQVTEIGGFDVRRGHWSPDGSSVVANFERAQDPSTYVVVLRGAALLTSHGR